MWISNKKWRETEKKIQGLQNALVYIYKVLLSETINEQNWGEEMEGYWDELMKNHS